MSGDIYHMYEKNTYINLYLLLPLQSTLIVWQTSLEFVDSPPLFLSMNNEFTLWSVLRGFSNYFELAMIDEASARADLLILLLIEIFRSNAF